MEVKLAEFEILSQYARSSDCVRDRAGERGRARRADQAEPADADRRWACC